MLLIGKRSWWLPIFYRAADDGGAGGGGTGSDGGAPSGGADASSAASEAASDNAVLQSDPSAGDVAADLQALHDQVMKPGAPDPAASAAGGPGAAPAVQPPAGAVDPFSPEQLRAAFGNAQNLENWARVQHVQIQQAQQRYAQQELQKFQEGQRKAWEERQKQQAEQKKPLGPFAFKDASLIDPEFIELAKHQDARYAELQQAYDQRFQQLQQQFEPLMQLRAEFEQMQNAQREQQAQQTFAQLDKLFAEQDAELFGTEPHNKLVPTSAEFQARRQMSETLARLEAGYRSRGEALPPLDQLVKVAYAATFHDRIASKALGQAAEQGNRLRGMTVAKPQTREPKRSPREEAISAARDAFGRFTSVHDDDMALIPE